MKLRDEHAHDHENFFHNWARLSPDDWKGVPLPFIGFILFLMALLTFGYLA